MKKMRVIGLTGGIASGKSTVSAYLAQKGFSVIDADSVSRALTAAGGRACGAIAEVFGMEYLLPNGALDRPKMSKLVFGDPQALQKLNALLHPLVEKEVLKTLAQCREREERLVFLDVPLLFESGMDRYCSAVWAVSARTRLRVRRAMERSGCSRAQALSRIRAQLTDRQRNHRATAVIHNNGTVQELYARVDHLLQGVMNETA